LSGQSPNVGSEDAGQSSWRRIRAERMPIASTSPLASAQHMRGWSCRS